MTWYVVLIIILMLGMSLAEVLITPHLPAKASHLNLDLLLNVPGIGIFFAIFGFLSRRFERQADVYAARTIEQHAASTGPIVHSSHVGPYGAAVFTSALYRVAMVNNIPIRARNFTHGSIATRMDYLKRIADDPRSTGEFDRVMVLLYSTMIVTLGAFGGAAWIYRDKLLG
jgi:STE24 endopeptidase